jgi:hypothetical protein
MFGPAWVVEYRNRQADGVLNLMRTRLVNHSEENIDKLRKGYKPPPLISYHVSHPCSDSSYRYRSYSGNVEFTPYPYYY